MKRRNMYSWVAFIASLILLLLLFGTLTVWVVYGSPAGVMTQTGLQRARVEHMIKDVLVLSYRSSPVERSVAISELQDTLPLWEQTQRGLQVGDRSLGLPKHPQADILLLMTQTQSDFTPMDVAFRKIENASSSPDPAQTQIIMDHERAYFVAMSNVNTLWQQHIDDAFIQLFWIEAGFVVFIALLTVGRFVFRI